MTKALSMDVSARRAALSLEIQMNASSKIVDLLAALENLEGVRL